MFTKVLILNNKMLFLYNNIIENKRLNNNTIFLIMKQKYSNIIKFNRKKSLQIFD